MFVQKNYFQFSPVSFLAKGFQKAQKATLVKTTLFDKLITTNILLFSSTVEIELNLILNIFKFRGVVFHYSITQIIDQFKLNYVTTKV